MAKSKVAGEMSDMAIKSPGIITFMVSVILTVLALVTKFYPEAEIPFISSKEFWVLLIAQVVLVLGCIMRGL
jgi:heme/copper-type cytochrome/quinol oxidase subunit 4